MAFTPSVGVAADAIPSLLWPAWLSSMIHNETRSSLKWSDEASVRLSRSAGAKPDSSGLDEKSVPARRPIDLGNHRIEGETQHPSELIFAIQLKACRTYESGPASKWAKVLWQRAGSSWLERIQMHLDDQWRSLHRLGGFHADNPSNIMITRWFKSCCSNDSPGMIN